MPRVDRILETALYVEDVERAARFYERSLGLRRMSAGEKLIPMDAGGGTVLLLFHRGSTDRGFSFAGGRIPPHHGSGPAHFAVAIASEEVEAWRRHLASEGTEVESEVTWPRGGISLYLRDPDGHSVELATPGLWPVY